MVITGERCLGPDIWPEIPNQDTDSQDMIFTTWYNEAIKQREINLKEQHTPSLTAKKACYSSDISYKYLILSCASEPT